MEKLTAFVQEHIADDLTRLVLDRKKWPDIDLDLAVSCIQSRRKLKDKVHDWYMNPELIFPVSLSAEQCSSTATGIYKAELALNIAGNIPFRLADLTGGLGVDSWYFSQKASQVWYHEMQEKLCTAAKHNFQKLNAENIFVRNMISTPETIEEIISDARPDIVYMDPARRGEGGKKVFLIEECTPDVLTLKEQIFKHCRHILIKLSPMADITMVCSRLGSACREVHVVAYGGECKELLIWMDREWNREYSITAVEISRLASLARNDSISTLSSKDTPPSSRDTLLSSRDTLLSSRAQSRDLFLFEPGKALMKAGFFDLIRDYFGIEKMGVSTHYYLTDDESKVDDLKKFGKVYSIISIQPLDKRTIKAAGAAYPRAEVTARNIPMDTETFRKKLGVTSGDDAHIFGLKSDSLGNLLIIGKRSV